jgi:hypothetical protein
MGINKTSSSQGASELQIYDRKFTEAFRYPHKDSESHERETFAWGRSSAVD